MTISPPEPKEGDLIKVTCRSWGEMKKEITGIYRGLKENDLGLYAIVGNEKIFFPSITDWTITKHLS